MKSIFQLYLIIINLVAMLITNVNLLLALIFIEIISIVFVFRKQIFNPLNYILTYGLLLVVSLYYGINSNFERSPFFFQEINDNNLIMMTLTYIIHAIYFLFIGFSIFKTNKERDINKNSRKLFLKIIFILFIGFGILNFIYLLLKGINFTNFNYTSIEIKNKGYTTIGYTLFMPIGIYVYRYYIFLSNKKKKIYCILALSSFMFKITTGRIYSSLAMMLILLFIEIYLSKKNNSEKFKILLKCCLGISILGIVIYFLRLYKGYIYAGLSTKGIMTNFIEKFSYYSIDKGNIPNSAILLRIIKEYGITKDFMQGKTFLSILGNNNYNPEILIKKTFYLEAPGGNLPTTIFGEMYMNFGREISYFYFILLGIFIKFTYNIFLKSQNFFIKILYIELLLNSYLLLFKGELALLNNLNIILILLVYISEKFFIKYTKILKNTKSNY